MLEEQLWHKRFGSIQKYSDWIKGSPYELESIFDIAKVAKDLRLSSLRTLGENILLLFR